MHVDVKAVLFDNDGTLVNTYWAITTSFKLTMLKIMGERNPDISSYVKLIGLPLADQFTYYSEDPKVQKLMLDDYRTYNEKLNLDKVDTFWGLPEALKSLHDAGIFLGVVTSKMHRTCEANLEANNIRQYFSYIQGLEDSEIHKPQPGALTHACKAINLDPSEVLYVGDSIYDLQSARGAGCKTCGVT